MQDEEEVELRGRRGGEEEEEEEESAFLRYSHRSSRRMLSFIKQEMIIQAEEEEEAKEKKDEELKEEMDCKEEKAVKEEISVMDTKEEQEAKEENLVIDYTKGEKEAKEETLIIYTKEEGNQNIEDKESKEQTTLEAPKEEKTTENLPRAQQTNIEENIQLATFEELKQHFNLSIDKVPQKLFERPVASSSSSSDGVRTPEDFEIVETLQIVPEAIDEEEDEEERSLSEFVLLESVCSGFGVLEGIQEEEEEREAEEDELMMEDAVFEESGEVNDLRGNEMKTESFFVVQNVPEEKPAESVSRNYNEETSINKNNERQESSEENQNQATIALKATNNEQTILNPLSNDWQMIEKFIEESSSKSLPEKISSPEPQTHSNTNKYEADNKRASVVLQETSEDDVKEEGQQLKRSKSFRKKMASLFKPLKLKLKKKSKESK